ncbi:uncharacterized protein VTP21DRAFT_3095 [Calcarisporiella thermophila]|uniref:uncharacterized protein n=1 Tax=Calcarisporiella thermophila TaxID=911321 RepID=UPI003742EAF8
MLTASTASTLPLTHTSTDTEVSHDIPRDHSSSGIVSPQLSGAETALCGATAGVVSRFVISPIDVVKIRLQLQTQPNTLVSTVQSLVGLPRSATPNYPSTQPLNKKYRGTWHGISVIVREEGPRALWKGNLSAELLYLSYGAVQFSAYRSIEGLLDSFSQHYFPLHPTTKSFLCGASAGSIATAATYPLDLMRTRFAMQGERRIYTGFSQAFRQIYQCEGIRGFYRGVVPTVVQIMPYMGLMFGAYDAIKRGLWWLEERELWPTFMHGTEDIVSGALAGVISKVGVFPMDVIRKRLQVQGPSRNQYVIEDVPRYSKSMFVCARQVIRHEGFFALYKGLTPGIIKAAPASAITFWVYGGMKDLLINMKQVE